MRHCTQRTSSESTLAHAASCCTFRRGCGAFSELDRGPSELRIVGDLTRGERGLRIA
jgi:hypothetical protein